MLNNLSMDSYILWLIKGLCVAGQFHVLSHPGVVNSNGKILQRYFTRKKL